jgi:ATP synthase protein I
MDKSRLVFRLLGAGLYIGLSIFLGVVGGAWLDRKLDTQPIFVIMGLGLGLIVAFWGFYRMIIPIIKTDSEPKPKREKRG